jgi:hypothetical protein
LDPTEEIKWGCRQLRNEEVQNWFSAPDIVTAIKSWKMRTMYTIFIGKSEDKRTLSRSERRWEDSTETDTLKTILKYWQR